jgi:hypothetical protein
MVSSRAKEPTPMPRYKVMVDDNFHYHEPDERREHGVYKTLADALAVCRAIVERSLEEERRPGISAEALFDRYTSFGDDPFIVVLDGADDYAKFSAWTYAKERAGAICGKS